MKLKDLINDKGLSQQNINVLGLSENSREIKKNYIFFFKNSNKSNENYILEAIEKGAKLIIYNKKHSPNIKKYKNLCDFYGVDDIENSMSLISKKFYKININKIKVFGITGTNGKSTVVNYIAQFIRLKKEKCGVIGTLGSGVYPNIRNKSLTTPNIININRTIGNLLKRRIKYLALEVSSHGIKQGRINGIKFDTAIFTNLSQDHLDYHKNMKDYFNTKLKLFLEYENKRKVICIDTSYGRKLKDVFKNDNKLKTVSIDDSCADFYASCIKYSQKGLDFTINSKYGKKNVQTNLYGEFSIINILICIAALSKNKKDYNIYIDNISKLKPVKGRMNKYYKKNNPITFIDFAHTPDAIKKVLMSIKNHYPNKEIITIFGCGGNRDISKRKKIGSIVSNLSNDIIITNDNPRNESSEKISKDIESGINRNITYKVILNRAMAIKFCLNKNNSNKIVLILGKGHEDFQIIKNKKIMYSDQNEVLKALKL